MHPFQRFTIITLHLNDIDCKGTHRPGRGKALQMNSERVFAATSAVSVKATNRKPHFSSLFALILIVPFLPNTDAPIKHSRLL